MKKIFKLLSLPFTLIAPTIAISCSTTNISFAVVVPWDKNLDKSFFDEIIKEYNRLNKLSNANAKEVGNEVAFVESGNDLANNLVKGASNVAILTPTVFYNNKDRDSVVPFIQTLTKAFNFEKENSYYKNGKENEDDLRKLAATAQKAFEAKKYLEWDDQSYGWDGTKYTRFYDLNKTIEYYRGVVMIWGNEDTKTKIKKAWDEKDWNTFRNFGIVTGKKTSASKYKLQEALFKKHFTKKGNEFTSFGEDMLKNADKYQQGDGHNISKGSLSKYHIVFDEFGAFAYKHNSYKGKKLDYYSTNNEDEKIEFLTTTEAMKYNMYVAKKSLDQKTIDLLAKAIINVHKNGKDNYGPRIGFNGYKQIKDIKQEVIDPFEKLFNNE
ncbi:High affinity transport system protein p37 precursor [Metamycoplasma arthritidis]|uniref:ABC transporter thiamine pyrophosphate-binding lipoprotein p37/Cypl n=1 Tax=Metamycoplasma arthritidis TaxID=2111 RepID=UPI001004DCFF|nr:alkylphosphonate ABC transporter substrate-binidng protein [Metamycoplasma arthritidis]VEU78575.1 High affinity transport system protein p37 precursor [Metamycoplasma arthritidis]